MVKSRAVLNPVYGCIALTTTLISAMVTGPYMNASIVAAIPSIFLPKRGWTDGRSKGRSDSIRPDPIHLTPTRSPASIVGEDGRKLAAVCRRH